ncbi:MAG: hypothetical protein M5R36_26535 [Deltaproteobacteria bacterium]|nr:hypothetical protein [Deltaproteobacteria bacterium]
MFTRDAVDQIQNLIADEATDEGRAAAQIRPLHQNPFLVTQRFGNRAGDMIEDFVTGHDRHGAGLARQIVRAAFRGDDDLFQGGFRFVLVDLESGIVVLRRRQDGKEHGGQQKNSEDSPVPRHAKGLLFGYPSEFFKD